MEHLNYCRQMVKQFTETMEKRRAPIEESGRRHFVALSAAIDLAQMSQKFILPDGGLLLDDHEFRALDEDEPLSLPHPFIALEYRRDKTACLEPWEVASSKAIVFARQRDNEIALMPVVWLDLQSLWVPFPEIWIPRTRYINRTAKAPGRGHVAFAIGRADDRIPVSDYQDEVYCLMSMLNALQCHNVRVETSVPRRAMLAGRAKRKGALPFDTYHVLTLDVPGGSRCGAGDGHGRSPREHLRRGHIRRLHDDRKIWVNATVVAAGRGAGKVHKDYRMRTTHVARPQ